MTHRYFRADASVYEQVRLGLDSSFGHPNNVAATCVEPAATAPKDTNGLVLLAVDVGFCEWPQVAAMLPGLIESQAVEEITEAQYQAALPEVTL